MMRFLLTAALVACFIWFGMSVNLGQRTLFGHIANIWASDEAEEMKEDVEGTTRPVIEKAKKGAKKGWDTLTEEERGDGGAPPLDAGPQDTIEP